MSIPISHCVFPLRATFSIIYIVIQVMVWAIETASFGKFKVPNKHEKDPWTWRIPGGILPGWLTRMAQGKKDFWKPYHDDVREDTTVAENEHEMGSIGQHQAWAKPGMTLPHVETEITSDGNLHKN